MREFKTTFDTVLTAGIFLEGEESLTLDRLRVEWAKEEPRHQNSHRKDNDDHIQESLRQGMDMLAMLCADSDAHREHCKDPLCHGNQVSQEIGRMAKHAVSEYLPFVVNKVEEYHRTKKPSRRFGEHEETTVQFYQAINLLVRLVLTTEFGIAIDLINELRRDCAELKALVDIYEENPNL